MGCLVWVYTIHFAWACEREAGTVRPLPRLLLGMLRLRTVPTSGQYVRTMR